MRRFAVAALTAGLAACSRDTSLPPPPGPGSVQGRVVYAVAGQATRVAASGARLTVLGTSIGTTAGSDGRFVVSSPPSDGDLLVQADLNGDGKPDRQTLLSLSALGARAGRDLALGDVVVVENARIRGRVLRGDVPSQTSGHAGIVVFVPQGPFTTLTGDDGSYVFENLPEGRISLTFFKDGYAPAGVDGIQLGAGQDFTARDVTLAPAPPPSGGTPAPGTVAGQLSFSPGSTGAGARVLATQLVPDPTFSTSVAASSSGAFSLPGLRPGLYQLEASKAGYATAVVANVMVGAGQTLQLAISLAAQGASVDPIQLGTVPSCVAGVRCDLPNACQVGAVDCTTGSPACVPVSNALDGISCGMNQVCSAGSCVSVCIAGASCHPPSDPCHEGVVSCTSGTPTCVAGAAVLADGTSCGANQVCAAGACTSCFAGVTCTPTNACDTGLTECSTGAQTCRDTGLPVADGTSCGTDLFCAAGACGPCQPGKACTPAAFPCHTGTTSCATGREVCVDTGAVLGDGTSCGTDLVCRSGGCLGCTAGAVCTPASACHTGLTACGTGLPVCVDQQVNVAAGTTCDPDRVCDGAGACVACVQGQACTPANHCVAGGIQCSTGAPVCAALPGPVNLQDGTVCGTDQVCSSGTCVGCVAYADCTPQNPCHYGKTSCATGTSVCGDTNVPLADGATCGTNLVCHGGACSPCAAGVACGSAVAGAAPAPGTIDPCKVYQTVCASAAAPGIPTCDGSQNQPDGTPCGTSLICRSGSCQTSPMAIVVAAGDGQHALPNQPLPQLLTVTIRDVLAQTGVAGQTVYVTPPPGAQVNRASATTDPTGVATFALTLGRAVGPQDFVVRHDPSYPSTTAVREWADAPADGTVIPLVDAPRTSNNSPTTGPGPAVNVKNPSGVAAASTGDVYFTEGYYCQVRKLSPAGAVTIVAGTSCGTSNGDGGFAVNAILNAPRALALDEANRRLYVAETTGNRVRAVDLVNGYISTVAGTGTAGTAPYGDGGPASQAQLSGPLGLAYQAGPAPALFVVDSGHALVRKVDLTTGLITTVLAGSTGACSASPVGLSDFAASTGYAGIGYNFNHGAIAFDAQGRAFVAGRLCGTVSGGAPFQGVVRLNADGTVTLVAGAATGGIGNAPATATSFGAILGLAFDPAATTSGSPLQNLFVTDGGREVIVRIDGVTSRATIVAGTAYTGTSAWAPVSSTGDFGPGPSATMTMPEGLAFVPGTRDLVFADYWVPALRVLAGAGSVQASTALLAAAGGDAQTVYPDQTLPAPLAVTLTEGAGTPVSGFPVRFSLDPAANGGGWLATSTATTSTSGIAATTARVGLSLGATRFLASFDDLHGNPIPGSPVAFTSSAVAPPSGTFFTVVNDAHVSASTPSGVPGAGAPASIASSLGSVRLADGSVAFVAGAGAASRVLRLAVDGTVTLLAGGGSSSADGIPAVNAQLNGAKGLAMSADGSTLFIGEEGASRVRAVNLSTGTISTVAGGVSYACPATGDGGPATAASLCAPGSLAVSGGSLFVAPSANPNPGIYWGDVKRVGIDPANPGEYGLLLPYLSRGASSAGQTTGLATATSATAPPTFWACGPERCSVAVDPGGVVYVSGMFFGGGFSGGLNASAPGIARVNPTTGALERIAGRVGATVPVAGLAVERAGFNASWPPTIAFDAAGNLWIANRSSVASEAVVGWVAPDAVTGHVEQTGGLMQVGQTSTPAVPAPGAYLVSGSAYLGNVWSFTFLPGGQVVLTDSGESLPSYSVRMIW